MTPEFLRLLLLERLRSFSFGRDLLSAIMVFGLILFILFYLVGIAIFLGVLLENEFEIQNIPAFLNTAAIYYLFGELIVRFFLQKTPLFDLNRYLHLPIKRSGIINFLLGKSLISTFTVMALILFLPITLTEIRPAHGPLYATMWLTTLIVLSLSLHWVVLWVKDVMTRLHPIASGLLLLPAIPYVLLYFDIVNIGAYTAPFFELSFSGPFALITALVLFVICYYITFTNYRKNAYIDQVKKPSVFAFTGGGTGLFSGFGVPGTMAESEFKLILRHKKSRSYLIMSVLFLLYGLLFYELPEPGEPFVINGIHIFVGVFITGLFFVQFGQFFLSWNSAFFDYYLSRKHGIRDLIRGKLLLLSLSCVAAFILSLPYMYFGWQILLVHATALLYNIGIGMHIIVMISLWKPKPMDINKGAMFNYDGVGFSQFLMAIPFFIAPYIVYAPVAIFVNNYAALAALSAVSLIGLLFHNRLTNISISIVENNRYKISSFFRRGT